MSKKSKKDPIELNILDMPEWKAKLFKILAWLLGFKGEDVYVITISQNNE